MPTLTYVLTTIAFLVLPATAIICSNFTVVTQSYFDRGGLHSNLTHLTAATPYSYRIGNGLICNETTASDPTSAPCPHPACLPTIVNGTVINQSGVANISLTDEDKAAAFELIGNTVQIPFPTHGSTTFGEPGAETSNTCVSPTWAGYLVFSPLLNCVNGIFSGCGEGSSIAEGTAVRACAPILNGTQLRGAIFFDQTSNGTANAVGPVPNPGTPEEDPFVGTVHSPLPLPTSVAATMVPGQPGLPTTAATTATASSVRR